jgi:mono/diheme cytochrome c family protein
MPNIDETYGPTGPHHHRGRRGPKAVVLLGLMITGIIAITGCGGDGGTVTTTASSTQTAEPAKPPTSAPGEGEAVFQAQCSSCHKLAAAKATFATFGPDLDQLKPSEEVVISQVTNGGGIMPAYGKNGILTASEIEAVATYVSTEAGK